MKHRPTEQVSTAELITHEIATKAKNRAFWFGIVASLFTFAALTWNIWSFRMKLKGDDEKWREERRDEEKRRRLEGSQQTNDLGAWPEEEG